LSWKKIKQEMCCFRIGTFKLKLQTKPTKQDLGVSKGLFSKFPTSTPVLSTWEYPTRGFFKLSLISNEDTYQKLHKRSNHLRFRKKEYLNSLYLFPSFVTTVQPSSRIAISGDPSQRTGSEHIK